jgi:putative sporulation protein YyaC
MAGHNDFYRGVALKNVVGREQITAALAATIPYRLTNDDVVFLCIGTDRSTGDSLGPLVGTYLTGLGYTNVIGTLDDPCHAMNLQERAATIPADKKVIAIDACLGKFDHIGTVTVINGSIKPGAGVGKNLGEYGDYSIQGVVNESGFMAFFVLQNTRLSLVMRMAKDITSAIVEVFPLEGQRPKQLRDIRNLRKMSAVKEMAVVN